MGKRRILVGYGVDVDAVANWLNTTDGSAQNPTNVSRGIFGATAGVDRLLKLFAKYNIKASFFTPAHTIESFPKQMAKVRDAGHEIGLHGYTHEHPSQLSPQQNKDVLDRSISVLTSFCHGRKPRGYTAPAWSMSPDVIPQLEAAGIVYDHSFMHHDFQMYFAPQTRDHKHVSTNLSQAAESWMTPMSTLKPSGIVEVPASWHIDDWPPLQPIPGRPGSQGFVDTATVEKLWREQWDFAYREYAEEGFVFPISIHPQVSGKGHVILMHERLIEYINSHEDVEWMTFEEMAMEFKEGRMGGVEVEGGVDL